MTLRILAVSALSVAVFSAGCSQPAAPGGAPATGEQQAAPTPRAAQQQAARQNPRAAAPKSDGLAPLPAGIRLVKNGEFEEWKDGAPVGWQVAALDTIAAHKPAQEGEISLGLLPREDNFTVAQQRLRPIAGGTKMQVHCLAIAPHVGAFTLKLQFKRGGKTEEASATYQKHHAWGSVGFDFETPQDADPSSYVLQLIRAKNVEGDVAVDAVSIITK